jgi:transcriptional regulator NrdR family protein
MDCPACGGRSSVTHTERASKRIVRDRRCKKCGRTFATEELVYVKEKKRRQALPNRQPATTYRPREELRTDDDDVDARLEHMEDIEFIELFKKEIGDAW